MDAQTRGRVVGKLRWLASEMQKGETVECPCGRHLRIRLTWWAQQLTKLSWEVTAGRPADGCRGCGGPVEHVRRGRPRVWCEGCHPTRRGGNKRSQKAM